MAEAILTQKVTNLDDPQRCRSTSGSHGQCLLIAAEGSEYCRIHSHASIAIAEQKITRNYRLNKWQARMEEFADSEKVKSLREEVGIIRILLEEIMNKCQDSVELLIHSSQISDLVLKIEKLVVSCHKLEASTGFLLDKDSVMNLANIIVNVISVHVTDPEKIDKISAEIVQKVIDQKKIIGEK